MGEWPVTKQIMHVRDETAGGALVGIRQLDVRSGDVDRRLVKLKRPCLVQVLGQFGQWRCPFLVKDVFDTRCNTGNRI